MKPRNKGHIHISTHTHDRWGQIENKSLQRLSLNKAVCFTLQKRIRTNNQQKNMLNKINVAFIQARTKSWHQDCQRATVSNRVCPWILGLLLI